MFPKFLSYLPAKETTCTYFLSFLISKSTRYSFLVNPVHTVNPSKQSVSSLWSIEIPGSISLNGWKWSKQLWRIWRVFLEIKYKGKTLKKGKLPNCNLLSNGLDALETGLATLNTLFCYSKYYESYTIKSQIQTWINLSILKILIKRLLKAS